MALEKIMLNCKSSIGDDVTYSWHRDSNGIPSRSTGKNSQTLTIPSATPRDEGMYYCKASKEGISVKSNRAVVTVNGENYLYSSINVPLSKSLSICVDIQAYMYCHASLLNLLHICR